MVPGISPVKLLVKVPVPIPLAVILPAVVGPVDVLQQTPRAVTLAPPSEVIFPPAVAVVVPTDEMEYGTFGLDEC